MTDKRPWMPADLLRPLDPLFGWLERRRVRKSFLAPVVVGAGRDALQVYTNGRSVVIEAELMQGELDRLIHRMPLYWTDSREKLSDAESDRIYAYLTADLDRRRIRWKYSS